MNSNLLSQKIKLHAVEMTHLSNGSHIGSVLSIADILGVLYTDVLKFDPHIPKSEDRDRFILSKGHASAGLYAALAERGFFPREQLETYCMNGEMLSGHVSHYVPGIEVSTGSLGHGIGIAAGMALAIKRDNRTSKVFVLMGDGECDEGSVWEAALFANHYNLNNLYVIIDHNKMQSLTTCERTISLGNLAKKWIEFGWNSYEVDGHSHKELQKVLNIKSSNKPTAIIAHTIKGKGISYMENNIDWHYKSPQGENYSKALLELGVEK